jgi:hypothetical protein
MKKLLIILCCSFSITAINAQENENPIKKRIDSIGTKAIRARYYNKLKTKDTIRKSTFNSYPFVSYTPETNVSFGAGGIFIYYTGKEKELNPSKLGFGGFYSLNNQYRISMDNDLYLFKNRLNIKFPINYGFYVNKFWGIGDDTQDYANAAYTATTFATTLTVQIPTTWFSADRAGMIFDYNHTAIEDKKGNELIDEPLVIGSNGGQMIGFGGDLVWDSREHLFTPKSGSFQYFKAVIYPSLSDFNFAFFEFDVRNFISFNNGGVFASNIFIQSATGNIPFYKLPSLGGKQMRGYFFGRYRDNFYAMGQVEYRKSFSKRWGYVLFGTVGNVAENIIEYDFKTLKYSFGSGVRYMFNKKERVNLRADIGIGADGNSGVYFGIEEAF